MSDEAGERISEVIEILRRINENARAGQKR